jgi:dihydrofolate reductase
MSGRLRVFIACSLDGFIAGPNDDISWLPPPDPAGSDAGYGAFMSAVGCILMGRKTYDVAAGFEGAWPYGDTPVHVVTSRTFSPKAPTVKLVRGEIGALAAQARAAAHGKDVYVDGGTLIRAALDAHLIDELIVTVVPLVLGAGHPLFAGTTARHPLTFVSATPLHAGMVQLCYRLAPSTEEPA